MIKRLLPFLCAAVALLAIGSCKKTTDSNPYGADATTGYYPLQIGHYVEYSVDSSIWNDFDCTLLNHHLQMRYTVSDTFRDNQGLLSYTIDVTSRIYDTLPWVNNEVIYATQTGSSLFVTQNNLRFQKLIFPVTDSLAWKGNSAIPAADQDLAWFTNWTYKTSNTGKVYNDGPVSYDNTVIVDEDNEQQNDPATMPSSYAYRTYSRDVYAYNVGLIYREFTHWTYDLNKATPPQYCKKGFSVVMRATAHN